MPWLAIGEFLLKLLSGEVWKVWKTHKANVLTQKVSDDDNKINSMSDSDVSSELRKYQRD